MKVISMLCCLFLVGFGFFVLLIEQNTNGIPPLIIGALSFIIIAPKYPSINDNIKNIKL